VISPHAARKIAAALAACLWGLPATVLAFDSYQIVIAANVMKGDPDVSFTVTPFTGAVPDLTPHNIYIDLPAGILENPLAEPPGGLDWSSIVAWGLFVNNAVAAGNTPITVTEAFAGVPVTTTKFFNLQNVVRSFEIVPPPAFTGQIGVPFDITIRAKDGLGGGGSLVSGFNDSVIVSASTGDVVVNGIGNIVSGGDFVNGEATVSVMLRGTDPSSRINRIIVTASINYFSLGLATGFADVSLDPGSYDHIILLFPGETLAPGRILIANGKTGTAGAATANIAVPNVTAYLVDVFNNPIITPPAPVTLAFESLTYPLLPRPPNDTVPGLKVINAGNNVLVGGEFVFYKANETHQVRAFDFDDLLKNSVTSVFVNSGSPNLIKIEPDIGTPQAPGTSFIVSARVVDGTPAENTVVTYNNPAVSVVLTNCAGISHPSGSLDANPAAPGIQTTVAFVAGVFSGPLQVFPRAASVCIKFDDLAGRFGESNSFQITNGGALRLHIVLPGQSFTPGLYPGNVPSLPTPKLAGDIVSAQIYVVDQGWNVIDSVTGGWTPAPVVISIEDGGGVPGFVDLTLGSPAMPASGAFATAAGIRLRTAYPAGNGRLVANMSGLSGQSDAWNILPTSYSQMVFVAPGENFLPGIPSAIAPDGTLNPPLDQSVNVNFTIGVYLTDDFFNPIVNPPLGGGLWPQLTFSLSAPPAGVVTFPFTNPFSMTDGSFNDQMSLGNLNANVVRVVDNSLIPKSVQQTLTVNAGEVEHFVVTPNPLSITADPIPIQTVGVPFNLTFKAFDDSIPANFLAKTLDGPVNVQLYEGGVPLSYSGTISPSTITFVANPVTGGVVADVPVTITYAGAQLGLGADQLQVCVSTVIGTPKIGCSAFFSVREDVSWSDVVVTLPGETRRSGLGLGTLKVGTPNPVTAGVSIPITVTAVDIYGNHINIAGVADLSIPTPGVFSSLPPQVTLTQGEGSGNAQVYTAGATVVHASVSANGFNDSSTVAIATGSYNLSTGRLVLLAPGETLLRGSPAPPGKSGSAAAVQANTAMSYTLLACDRFYNRDVTYTGNTFSLNSNDTAIALAGIPVINGSGTVSSVFLKGNLPNPSTVRVTATDQADTAKTSFSDVPVDPGAFYEITTPTSAVVGSTFTMTVTLRDPVTLLPVPVNTSFTMESLTPSGAASAVTLGIGLATLSGGVATIDQFYGHVETIKIRIRDSFNRIVDSNNIDMLPTGLKYRVTLPSAKTTDDTFSVVVGLYDVVADALPIQSSSYQHTFNVAVEFGGLPAVGNYPVTAATLSGGEATFNFSYTKAEFITVRVSGTLPGFTITDGVDDMDITPGAYVKVQILAPGEVSVPGIPSPTGKDSSGLIAQASREPFSLTVNAVDRYWNIITSLNTPLAPTVQLQASDGSIALPLGSYSGGVSLFTGVSLNTPPEVTVTARDTGNTALFPHSAVVPVTGRTYLASATSPFAPDFYSGPPRSFDVDLELRRFTGSSAGSLVAGFAGEVTITPLSLSLDPLPAANLVILNPPPVTGKPTTFTMMPSGLITLTLGYRVAEDVILKFVDEDGWQGFSAPISFIPQDVFYTATLPAETTVGPPESFTMVVTPLDTGTGTVPKNWSGTVAITPLSPAALPVTGTLQVPSVLVSGGATTFQQAYSQAGLFNFELREGPRIANTAAMNFKPGPLAALTTNLPSTLEAGTLQTVQVTLRDAFGNPIPNLSAVFGLSDAAFGVFSTNSGVTDVFGVASTQMTTNAQKSGAVDFTATSGDIQVRQGFRLLGPPATSLVFGGKGEALAKGHTMKPGDPLTLIAVYDISSTLVEMRYFVDNGPFLLYTGPFTINTVGVHTIQHFGVTQSALTHTETTRTSDSIFVSAETTVGDGLLNYPNPFEAGRDVTYVEYVLGQDSNVKLTIYDMLGQIVYETEKIQGEAGGQSGLNRLSWDGRNGSGQVVGNGGYVAVVELKAEGRTLKRKIAVRK